MEKEGLKLFLMIPNNVFRDGVKKVTITLLDCLKMNSFKGVLPTMEILRTHFKLERAKLQKAKLEGVKYTPLPLVLNVSMAVFIRIVKEAKTKNPNAAYLKELSLTLNGEAPCCVIMPKCIYKTKNKSNGK